MKNFFNLNKYLANLAVGLVVLMIIASCSTDRTSTTEPLVITPPEPLTGAISYRDVAVLTGTGKTVNVDETDLNRGEGNITYTSTVTPTTGNAEGITVNSTDGTVTIPDDLVTGDYTVAVTVRSDVSGQAATTFMVTVSDTAIPLSGTISYRDVAVLAGTERVIRADRGNLTEGTGNITYTVDAVAAGNGVTVNGDGMVTIPDDLTAADYDVTVTVNSDVAGSANPSDSFTVTVSDTPIPLTGAISYENVAVNTGQARAISVNRDSLNEGTGNITYTRTVSPAAGDGIIVNNTGLVVVPNNLGAGEYTVEVTINSDVAGSTSPSASFTVTVSDTDIPLSGDIAYGDVTVRNGTVRTVSIDETDLTKGTGNITYARTVSPTTGNAEGITVNDAGLVTIPANLATGSYTVTITVSSDVSGSATDSFTVTVSDSDVPLTGAISYSDISLRAGQGITLSADKTALNEGTGDITYARTVNPTTGNATGITVNDSGVVVIPNNLAAATYTVTITVSSTHTGTDSASFTVTVSDSDIPLTGIISYSDVAVITGTGTSLSVDDSNLNPGTGNITYTRTVSPAGGNGITVNGTGVVTIPNTLTAGEYTVEVMVNSDVAGSASPSASFTVTVSDTAIPLTGIISYSHVVVRTGTGTSVRVDEGSLTRGTGNITYTRTVSPAGGNGITINNDGLVIVPNTLTAGDYSVTVTVSSDVSGSASPSASFMVTVSDTAIPLTGAISYDNVAVRTGTETSLRVNDINLNPGTGNITYTRTVSPTAGNGIIVNDTGVVVVPNTLATGVYTVTVTVSSDVAGSASPSDSFTVTVNDDAVPLTGVIEYSDVEVVLGSGTRINVDESGLFKGTGNITYERTVNLARGNGIVVDNNGVVVVPSDLTAGVYTVTVTVNSDVAGSASPSDSFDVTVSNNDVPLIGSISYGNVAVRTGEGRVVSVDKTALNEGTGNITYTRTVSPTTGNANGIIVNNTGVVVVPNDVEAGTYTVTVMVNSDVAGSASPSASFDVTVSEDEVVLSGGISYSDLTVVFGTGGSVDVDDSALDGGTGEVTYSITSGSQDGITINPTTGRVSVAGTVPQGTYNLIVTAASDDTGTAEDDFVVTVNTALDGSINYADLTVTTGSGAGTGVAGTESVDTTSLVPGTGEVTYSITGGSQTGISVNPNTGLLSVANTTDGGVYNVTVTASSTHTGTASDTVTVTVRTPLSGSVAYDNITLLVGDTARTLSSTGTLVPGTGDVTYDVTVNPTTGNANGIAVSDSGQVTTPANLQQGSYTVTVTATSSHTGSAQDDFVVTVNTALSGSIDYANLTVTTAAGAGVAGTRAVNTSGLTPGSGNVTYRITSANVPGISINNSTGLVSVANTTDGGVYNVSVTASSTHTGTDSDTFTVTVRKPLTGNISYGDISLVAGNTATRPVDTSGLTRGTGELTYTINNGGRSEIRVDASTGQVSVASTLGVGTYPVTVTVNSSHTGSDSDTFDVTVSRVITALTGSISYADLTVLTGTGGSRAVNTGSLNQGTGTISYSIVSGGRAGISINSGSGLVTVAASVPQGGYNLRVRVSSTDGGTREDDFTVTVNTALSGSISYADLTVVTGTGGSRDVNTSGLTTGNGTISYSIVSGNRAGISINSGSGRVTVAGSVPEGVYDLRVQVSSSVGGTDEDDFTVTVNTALGGSINYNDVTLLIGSTARNIAVDDSSLVEGSGNVTYTMSVNPTTGNANGIAINSGSGQITIPANLQQGSYTVNVTATSSHTGSTSDSFVVTVNTPLSGSIDYTDLTVLAGTGGSRDVNTSGLTTGNGTISYSIVSGSRAGISINSGSGRVTIAGSVPEGVYDLTVRATSSVGGTDEDDFTVTVNTALSGSIAYADLTVVTGTGGNRDVNTSGLTAGNGTLTYSITAGARDGISINSSTGRVSIAGRVPQGSYDLTVQVSSSVSGTAEDDFTVTVNTALSGSIAYSDFAVETTVGGTSDVNAASLVNGSGVVTYSVTSGATSGITVNATTGRITVGTSVPTGRYPLEITASSTHTGTASDSVVITVAQALAGSFSYTAPTAANVVRGTSTTISPDLSNLVNYETFSIRRTSTGDIGGVSINNSGVITVNSTSIGSSDYVITANGLVGNPITANITIKNSYQLDTSTVAGNFSYYRVNRRDTLPLAAGGDASVWSVRTDIPNRIGHVLDGDRTSIYSFTGFGDIDFRSFGFTTGSSNGSPVSYVPSIGGLFLQQFNGNYGSLGIVINSSFVNTGQFDVVIETSVSGSPLSPDDMGYSVAIADGRSFYQRASTNPVVNVSAISNDNRNPSSITSRVNYDGGSDRKITMYFTLPQQSTVTTGSQGSAFVIHSITVIAR